MAKSPLSKRRRTPRKRKATPNPARPTPISKKGRKFLGKKRIKQLKIELTQKISTF
jgi:hypothetical protein